MNEENKVENKVDEVVEEGVSDVSLGASDTPTETSATEVTFEEFAKLEIKIGTIKTVEVVEGADKLLRLEVDFGTEERQIVSGIREYFIDPQELVGKQNPFITNLKPRVIRGLESQGMILAAHNGEDFALLDPNVPLPAGTIVR
ncbi:methionine--tRNA ligase subunit beta [bacterium]|mgnify:CR=1 FL=1|nr:methionine--tRNA ligase subunit beta [bacterium]|tara:strand:- start:71 stop:502 length:432 start_codon:yes stop_codon:yes gene_type:complete